MALHPHQRENLLRDATQYAQRVRLQFASDELWESVFIGMRREGGWSIYFDEQPVWHFNAAGQLRRAYVDGRRLAAARGRLEALERPIAKPASSTPTPGRDCAVPATGIQRLQLVPQPLSSDQSGTLLQRCQGMLSELVASWPRATTVEQINGPTELDAAGQAKSLIQKTLASEIAIARSPRA